MLTVAYVGFGNSVRRYHIPYVENRENVKVKYVYCRPEDRPVNQESEPYYPEIIFTTDFDTVLNDPEINLVVVNTPDRFHVSYAKQILNAGKNALIEKPFAMTPEEAAEVFALAKEKGLVAMPNQNRRFDSDYSTVKEVVKSGKLGRIVEVESHYDYYKPNAWGPHFGVLYGLAVHPLDQIVDLLGIPEKLNLDVRSIWHPGESDDYYDLDLFYNNGVKATVKTSTAVMIDNPRFVVHGTKGSFVVMPLGHQSAIKDGKGRIEIPMEAPSIDKAGFLKYINDNGEIVEERVPLLMQDYGKIYDNLDAVINGDAEKLIKDEEVEAVLDIIVKGTEIAKGNK